MHVLKQILACYMKMSKVQTQLTKVPCSQLELLLSQKGLGHKVNNLKATWKCLPKENNIPNLDDVSSMFQKF